MTILSGTLTVNDNHAYLTCYLGIFRIIDDRLDEKSKIRGEYEGFFEIAKIEPHMTQGANYHVQFELVARLKKFHLIDHAEIKPNIDAQSVFQNVEKEDVNHEDLPREVKLDTTLPRTELMLEVESLKRQGYVFEKSTQTWCLPDVIETANT